MTFSASSLLTLILSPALSRSQAEERGAPLGIRRVAGRPGGKILSEALKCWKNKDKQTCIDAVELTFMSPKKTSTWTLVYSLLSLALLMIDQNCPTGGHELFFFFFFTASEAGHDRESENHGSTLTAQRTVSESVHQ